MPPFSLPPEPLHSPDSGRSIPEVDIAGHEEVRSEWSTFHRITYRIRRSGRDWVAQEREFLDRGDAVALLPYCPETGKVLLTRQFRMPIFVKRPSESALIEVAGGILDNVDPRITAQHEAAEELGLELDSLEPVFEAYSSPGSVTEKARFFVAPYRPEQRRLPGGGRSDEGEDIEILEMPLAEAVIGVQSGAIQDLRTVALIFYLCAAKPDLLKRTGPDNGKASESAPSSQEVLEEIDGNAT